MEWAKEQSDDLHLQLLINSGGYARLNKLNEQQKREIRNSRPKPREETPTKSPYREVDSKRRRIEPEVSPFKKPLNGNLPPQRTLNQRNRVNEWVVEQQELGQNILSTAVGMMPFRTPRIEQRKRNESALKLIVSTREQGSQVEEEIPEPLRKLVVEMVEEQIKLPPRVEETQTKEKEGTEMVRQVANLPRHVPIDSPLSYTTEVRKFQENEELRNDTYSKKREISRGITPEIIYSQKYVSDEERMRGLSIPKPINLGHLSPPRIFEKEQYRVTERQQTPPRKEDRKQPRDIPLNEEYKS